MGILFNLLFGLLYAIIGAATYRLTNYLYQLAQTEDDEFVLCFLFALFWPLMIPFFLVRFLFYIGTGRFL